MASDKQIRVTFTLSQEEALRLIQLAQSQFELDLVQDIQLDIVENPSHYNDTLIFMSYRRSDSRDICGRIYDYLVQEFDELAIFRDIENIPVGLDFSDEIVSNAESCTMMLAIIGPTWLDVLRERNLNDDEVDYVRLEIETALKRNIPVVPIYENDAKHLLPSDLPESLREMSIRNAVVIRPDAHFRPDVRDLIRKIKQLLELIDDQEDS